MFMHTATYYMNMYGYMYMAFGLFNAAACKKCVSIEAELQYLKYSNMHLHTDRRIFVCNDRQ